MNQIENQGILQMMEDAWRDISTKTKIAALTIIATGLGAFGGEYVGENIGYCHGFNKAEKRISRCYQEFPEICHRYSLPASDSAAMHRGLQYRALVHGKIPEEFYYISRKDALELKKMGEMGTQEFDEYLNGLKKSKPWTYPTLNK